MAPSKLQGKRNGNKKQRPVKKKKLNDLSMDEFMAKDFSNSSDEGEDILDALPKVTDEDDDIESPTKVTNEEDATSNNIKEESEQHKASLNKLKQTDPEFYKFLEQNDKELLNFEYSSSDSDGDDDEKYHKPSEHLEVASDESELDEDEADLEEMEGTAEAKGQISIEQINIWRKKLEEKKPLETIAEINSALKLLVQQLTSGNVKPKQEIGSTIFNRLMQLCIRDFVPAVNKLMHIPEGKTSFNPTTSKIWRKLQGYMNGYLMQLLKILPEVASPALIKVLLKHILQLIPYLTCFTKLSKAFLKKFVYFWSTGEESVRVLAFLCIIRTAQKLPGDMLQNLFKIMYLAYVKNCKFTSPSTWPMINFMKHSLIEVLGINNTLAYQHAFVYIRQLAIHLRNAVTVKKKDSIKTVYNWQYIHCLYFWSYFVGKQHWNTVLQPLIHPLTQIITGTIKLVPTAKYIPLRFHCIRALTVLSRESKTFIPILPFLIEGLEIVDFNKKNSRVSWKPLDFTCAIKLSKSQLEENGFKDAVMDQFYELLMDYLSIVSHCLGFPELVLTTILQMRIVLKNCKVSNYNKQLKQLLEKINENSEMISEKRKTVSFSIADIQAVKNFENEIKSSGTPILNFYAKYRKLRDKEISLGMSQKEQLDDYDLPQIKRKELMRAQKEKDKEEFTDLFGDDTDESDNDARFAYKEEKEINT